MIYLVIALYIAGAIDAYVTVAALSPIKGWRLWCRLILWPICTFVYLIESLLGI